MHRTLAVLILSFLVSACDTNKATTNKKILATEIQPDEKQWQRLHQSLDSVKLHIPLILKTQKLIREYVLIAHLGIHSGLPRLVLWDVKNKQITDSGCVAHGYGKQDFSKTAIFSNMPGSFCSSLGRYRVGVKYKGNFGWSYKLHGIDKTNTNAFSRFIVLHAYKGVPDGSIYPAYTCNSQGCPMTSQAYLKRLSKVIDSSAKPLLLWIIE